MDRRRRRESVRSLLETPWLESPLKILVRLAKQLDAVCCQLLQALLSCKAAGHNIALAGTWADL